MSNCVTCNAHPDNRLGVLVETLDKTENIKQSQKLRWVYALRIM